MIFCTRPTRSWQAGATSFRSPGSQRRLQSPATTKGRRAKSVFGQMIDNMYEQSPKDELHIQRFLSANCFGGFYTRTGLDIKLRELVTLSVLIAMGVLTRSERAR